MIDVGRRGFLAGLGAAALCLPFLDSLGRTARAAPPTLPRRLIVMFTPSGTVRSEWKPSGTETDFKLKRILNPLDPNDIVVVDGLNLSASLDSPGGPHAGIASLLTGQRLPNGTIFKGGGYPKGPSLDVFVGDQLGAPEGGFRSLQFGVQVDENRTALHTAMSWEAAQSGEGSGTPIVPSDDPSACFDRIFDIASDPHLRDERKSVLDYAAFEFDALQRKVSASDRSKLEAHLDRIRDLEKRIDASGPICGTVPEPPTAGPDAALDVVGKQQMDTLVAALACNVTRVATLQWTNAVGAARFPQFTDINKGHHGLSHDQGASAQEALVKINQWFAQQLRYLVDALKAVPESDGKTLYDSTLVVWCSEVAEGSTHTHKKLPFVLVGPCGGAVKTGRNMTFSDKSNNDLLISVCRAMGVEVDEFGDGKYCHGGLPGLVTPT